VTARCTYCDTDATTGGSGALVIRHRDDCPDMLLVKLASAIRRRRFRYANEADLQEGLAAALTADGWPVEREVRLDAKCRVDLLIGRIGIEVKVASTADEVERQVRRYLDTRKLDAIVVVTSRVRHLTLPIDINGRPIEVVTLAGRGL
jgi:hypothetical protein